MIVLHYTGMRDGPSAVDWLCNPASQVSCHYVVEEDGHILGLLDEERRAWHAGRSSWAGATDLNSLSIGVEIVNGGHDFGLPAFSERQIGAVAALCRTVVERYDIRPERVLAHSDIAPKRKRDPGERFPWQTLALEGVGLFPMPLDTADDTSIPALGDTGPAVQALQDNLIGYGYGLDRSGVYDDETTAVVRAFQRHFRPQRVDGMADAGTRAMLAALLTACRSGDGRQA